MIYRDISGPHPNEQEMDQWSLHGVILVVAYKRVGCDAMMTPPWCQLNTVTLVLFLSLFSHVLNFGAYTIYYPAVIIFKPLLVCGLYFVRH